MTDLAQNAAGKRTPKPTDVRCIHCGLPVPAGLVDPEAEEQFCCNGCRTVYAMIHGCGLDRFYRLRDETGADPAAARTTARQYGEFDDPLFHDLYVQQHPDGTQSTELYLEGVHCAACVWLVEKLPRVAPGVIEARLDMRRSLVRVRWDPVAVRLSRIALTLDSLGYPPHPAKDVRAREQRRREDRRFLIRMAVAAACAGNVMTLAFALYGGTFTGIEAQYATLFRWASMGFGLIAVAWPGSIFFRGAWAAIRTRTAHLDLPIALGLAAGTLAGTINAVLGRGEIYFDSITMLVFLLLVGRWIQHRQQRWAGDAIEQLYSLTPTTARRVEDGVVVEVPIEAVAPGDTVEIRAGDAVPADGMILEGVSSIDQSLLTGESYPVAVACGDAVHAGTANLQARLLVRVEAVGESTRVGGLMRLIEECSRRRAPLVQMADRIAGRFVQVVIALAVATFALWLWLDPPMAVDHAVALLIVTCPCGLGLATPLAVTVALGRAAHRGILIKGGEVLERLTRRGTMLLDKTGTITVGRASVVHWTGPPDVLALAAALEMHSAHPVARAIVAAADEAGEPSAPSVGQVEETTGRGITGTVDGRRVLVGSASFVRSRDVRIPPEIEQAEREAVAAGLAPVMVAVDGRCEGLAGIGDPIDAKTPAAIQRLRRLGWHLRILSGDHPAVVQAAGRRLGFADDEVVGGVSPEEKVAAVREAAQTGSVVMVGDGINDAAALSAASVGVAVHGGAEASLAAADVYFNRPGLQPILDLLGISHSTVRAIHVSLAASLAYNLVAASLAVGGVIGPLTAAVLMPVSSFTVLTLAYAVPRFGGRR